MQAISNSGQTQNYALLEIGQHTHLELYRHKSEHFISSQHPACRDIKQPPEVQNPYQEKKEILAVKDPLNY